MRDRPEKRRAEVALVCTQCQARNYKTTKRPEQVLELRKFCKTCGTHTVHRESK